MFEDRLREIRHLTDDDVLDQLKTGRLDELVQTLERAEELHSNRGGLNALLDTARSLQKQRFDEYMAEFKNQMELGSLESAQTLLDRASRTCPESSELNRYTTELALARNRKKTATSIRKRVENARRLSGSNATLQDLRDSRAIYEEILNHQDAYASYLDTRSILEAHSRVQQRVEREEAAQATISTCAAMDEFESNLKALDMLEARREHTHEVEIGGLPESLDTVAAGVLSKVRTRLEGVIRRQYEDADRLHRQQRDARAALQRLGTNRHVWRHVDEKLRRDAECLETELKSAVHREDKVQKTIDRVADRVADLVQAGELGAAMKRLEVEISQLPKPPAQIVALLDTTRTRWLRSLQRRLEPLASQSRKLDEELFRRPDLAQLEEQSKQADELFEEASSIDECGAETRLVREAIDTLRQQLLKLRKRCQRYRECLAKSAEFRRRHLFAESDRVLEDFSKEMPEFSTVIREQMKARDALRTSLNKFGRPGHLDRRELRRGLPFAESLRSFSPAPLDPATEQLLNDYEFALELSAAEQALGSGRIDDAKDIAGAISRPMAEGHGSDLRAFLEECDKASILEAIDAALAEYDVERAEQALESATSEPQSLGPLRVYLTEVGPIVRQLRNEEDDGSRTDGERRRSAGLVGRSSDPLRAFARVRDLLAARPTSALSSLLLNRLEDWRVRFTKARCEAIRGSSVPGVPFEHMRIIEEDVEFAGSLSRSLFDLAMETQHAADDTELQRLLDWLQAAPDRPQLKTSDYELGVKRLRFAHYSYDNDSRRTGEPLTEASRRLDELRFRERDAAQIESALDEARSSGNAKALGPILEDDEHEPPEEVIALRDSLEAAGTAVALMSAAVARSDYDSALHALTTLRRLRVENDLSYLDGVLFEDEEGNEFGRGLDRALSKISTQRKSDRLRINADAVATLEQRRNEILEIADLDRGRDKSMSLSKELVLNVETTVRALEKLTPAESSPEITEEISALLVRLKELDAPNILVEIQKRRARLTAKLEYLHDLCKKTPDQIRCHADQIKNLLETSTRGSRVWRLARNLEVVMRRVHRTL